MGPMPRDPEFSAWERFKIGLLVRLGGWLCRLWFATCRVEILSPEEETRFLKGREPCVAVTWHRGAIFFLWLFGRLRPAIMVSRSRDGEYLARFISMMGGIPVRGSSHHGGRQALERMAEMLRAGLCQHAATVADGPRGPRYVAKKGMVALASRTGLPLLPIMWSADRLWTFPKSWDHTILPKPFARIKVKAGRILRYPPRMTPEQTERARQQLEDELNRLKDELDRLCGYQEPA